MKQLQNLIKKLLITTPAYDPKYERHIRYIDKWL